MTKIDIILPVYNEGENIEKALCLIEKEVSIPHNLLIVYDFDEDTTLPVAKAIGLGNLKLVKNKYGKGVLNAIKTGLESAENEFVIVTMADLSDPPSVINKMVEKAENRCADVVCASRYMKGGKQIGGSFLKGLMSRCAGLSLHFLAGVKTHDSTNSFKLYKKTFLEKQTIESTGGFELGLELVVKAHLQGFKVEEVPTVWRDRTAGESNFKLVEWLPSYLKWYFKAFGRKNER